MRVWLFGILAMVAAFILHATALDQGQLSAVEPISPWNCRCRCSLRRGRSVRAGPLEWASTNHHDGASSSCSPRCRPRRASRTGSQPHDLRPGRRGTAGTVAALCLLGRIGHGPIRARRSARPPAQLRAHREPGEGVHVAACRTAACSGCVDLADLRGDLLRRAGVILVQAALHAGRLVAAQPGITLMDRCLDAVGRGWCRRTNQGRRLSVDRGLVRSPCWRACSSSPARRFLEDNSEDAPRVPSPTSRRPGRLPHPA